MPGSHASTSSLSVPQHQPPRAPLPPYRLAKLANALGVAAPLPLTGSGLFLSPTSASPGRSLSPFSDGRAGTPPVLSTHNLVPQSKYLLHVIPPSYLPHDTDASDASDLTPPPPGASGYHTQFRRGTLVALQSTLHAQLVVIAREYALPSTAGMVLYLVGDSSQPGPRLSEDMWRYIWSRVLNAERDEAASLPRSPIAQPSPSSIGLGLRVPAAEQPLRPLMTPKRAETPLPLSLPSPVTPSVCPSSSSDLRSYSQSAPPFLSCSDLETPETSPDSIELPGLKTPSIIPILAKVEFDIDRRRAGWYEPWVRSRRIAHACRAESRSSQRTHSRSRTGDDASSSCSSDKRVLKLVERMQKPVFLRGTDESDDEQPVQSVDEGYVCLADSPDADDVDKGNELADVDATARVGAGEDPLMDVFGTDAQTWADIHSESVKENRRSSTNPGVVPLALDASSLAELPLSDEHQEQDAPDDAEEIQKIMQRMSGSHARTSMGTGASRRPIPPPLIFMPQSPKEVVSGEQSSVQGPVTPPTVEDAHFRGKEGISLELEQEFERSRSPSEDKRVGALFEHLDLGLDLDDDNEVNRPCLSQLFA